MNTLPITAEPDALDVIEEEARAVAQFFGVERCDVAAEMLVKRIADRLGGREVWVQGALGRAATRERHAQLRRRYNSRNPATPIRVVIGELALEAGMSERQVRRIVTTRN